MVDEFVCVRVFYSMITYKLHRPPITLKLNEILNMARFMYLIAKIDRYLF